VAGGAAKRFGSRVSNVSLAVALVTLLVGAGLLPADQAEAEQGRAPLFAPVGEPPGPIPSEDRMPVLAVGDENGVRNPKQAPITLPRGVPPDQAVAGTTRLPSMGGPNFNVFGVGPDASAHVAQVFTQDVNYQAANGEWRDVRSRLVTDPGYGWKATVRGVTVHFPTRLSSSTPVRVDFPDVGSLSAVPQGVDAAAPAGGVAGWTVTYRNALPHTDLAYSPTLGGYKEAIVLKDSGASGELSYTIQARGLTLRTTPPGDVEVLQADRPVAVIPAPIVTDSAADPASDLGTYSLQDLGSGAYRLGVTIDRAFLASATYPVTVDPGFQEILSDTSDTFVNSANPDYDFSSNTGLWVGAGTDTGRTFVRFNATGLARTGRLVYGASLLLDAYSGPNLGPLIDASRVTSAWPTPLTWNTQPTVGAVIDSYLCGGCSGWNTWQLKSMYQHILDPSNPDPWTDYGVRLSTSPTASYTYYSANSILVPRLWVSYNDLPDAPSLSFPRDNYVSENDSPTLKVSGTPSDPNGDEVLVQYQVSDDPNDFTGNHLIQAATSAWTDERSYVVPSGILADGQTYYWRARSWDICPDIYGNIPMCSLTDGQGVVREQKASPTRAITIVLKHFGDDPRWAMWSHDLGNGMTAKVNEANGNLFLDLPLDTLSTAVGDLSAGLSYNSQQNADLGLTPGWDLAIGPRSSARDLPKELVKLGDPSDFPDAGVKIKLGGGRAVYFPHRERRVFASVGSRAGVVKQNVDGTFLYTEADGSTYTFKASGKLIEANPASSQVSSGDNSLKYTFNGSEQLTRVTDPKGRFVDVNWSAGNPSAISTWAGQTWNLSYSGGHLATVSVSVTNPSTLPNPTTVTETVGFSYNGDGLLQEIDNGVTSAANRTGWVMTYILDPKGNYRVSTITAPGGGAPTTPTPWTFEYAGPYYGSTASTACVTDPLVTPAAQFCTGAHQTKVDFNTTGLPIRIGGPADQTGYWPVTTLIWDSNNNLVCKRTPAANAALAITDPDACKNDARSTRFTYNNDPPFQMLTEKHPAPNANGTGARVLDTYQYDADTNGQNFNGLWVEKYGSGHKDLDGVPAEEGVWYGFDQTWGAGAPPGVPGGGDNWSLRWSGYLNLTSWAAAKRAAFRVTTFDEGVTLIVGNTALLDCVGTTQPQGTYNCGTNQDVTKRLWPGLRPITIEYAELSGNASFKLEWDQGTGNWQTIPDFKFQSNLGLVVFKTTNDGTNDVLQTHYVFDTDDAKARRLPSRVSVKDLLTTEARKTDYAYNQYGQVTTVTTAADTAFPATTTNTYTNDATTSCLTKVVGPPGEGESIGAETDYACNGAGDVTSATQVVRAKANQVAQDRVTTTQYDSLGRVTKVTKPSGGYTITTYDRAGRPVNLDQNLGTGVGHNTHAYTDYVYDDAGHLTDETLPVVPDPSNPGQTIRPTVHHVFDWLDDEVSRTDVRNKVWLTDYDALRRVIRTTSPSGLVGSIEYRLSSGGSYQNRVTTWTPPGNPGGVATVTNFNVLGWKTSEQVGSLTATTYSYDPLGKATLVTDPALVKTHYDYNGFSQVTTRIDFYQSAQAATTTFEYDAAGRLSTLNGPRTPADVDDSLTYAYDLAGRLTSTTQNGVILPGTPNTAVTTTYVWDDAGERVRVTQPMSSTQNLVRNWTYDTSGRVASYADAKGTTTYSYGAGDQLESVADPRNLTLKFEYDNLGRRTRRYALSGGNTIDDQTFTNDLAGNTLTAKVVASGTTITMDYDNDARPSHVYQASYPTPTTTYTYSQSTGRLTSVVDPAGTTTYDYNANGQLFHLTDPFNSSSQVTYGYEPGTGRLKTRTDPAGLTWTRNYESGTGRLDTQTIVKAGTQVGSFDLGYDLASNVTSRIETVKTETGPNNADSGTWTYGYDAANRMTSSTAPSGTVTTYGYDGASNRTSVKVGNKQPTTTSYDAAGLPTTSSDNTTYSHDAIGELTKIDRSPGTSNDWNYAYNAWGVVTSGAHVVGTPDVSYTTDALDRVLSRTASATTTSYTYRGTGEEAAKAQVGAATPVFYAFSPGGPLARRTGTDATTLRYFVKDLHGDVVGLAATTGTNPMKGSILYSPWGMPGTKTGELATFPAQGHLGFQGQLTDALTGQVDMLTRYYEPIMGRFDTRDVLFGDPTDPTSLNQAVYGQDAPVTSTDRTGMKVEAGGGAGPCDRKCQAELQGQIDDPPPPGVKFEGAKPTQVELYRIIIDENTDEATRKWAISQFVELVGPETAAEIFEFKVQALLGDSLPRSLEASSFILTKHKEVEKVCVSVTVPYIPILQAGVCQGPGGTRANISFGPSAGIQISSRDYPYSSAHQYTTQGPTLCVVACFGYSKTTYYDWGKGRYITTTGDWGFQGWGTGGTLFSVSGDVG
jgi:RHS repeat-associated protein